MPRGWLLGALLALVGFVLVWTPVTIVAVDDGGSPAAAPAPPTPPPKPRAHLDGTWNVVPDRSYARTELIDVADLTGSAVISRKRVVRAHLRGGRATFDLDESADLRRLHPGGTRKVRFRGTAKLLFLSRALHVPLDVHWLGRTLTLTGRSGRNELRVELRRAAT
jgi:hypothetical protein